jgi:hypothetical protein
MVSVVTGSSLSSLACLEYHNKTLETGQIQTLSYIDVIEHLDFDVVLNCGASPVSLPLAEVFSLGPQSTAAFMTRRYVVRQATRSILNAVEESKNIVRRTPARGAIALARERQAHTLSENS